MEDAESDRRGIGEVNGGIHITIILLPPKSPELNPVEIVWQDLRSNYLSNCVFKNHAAIVDAACDAWNALIKQPNVITSIGTRDWAHEGLQLLGLE